MPIYIFIIWENPVTSSLENSNRDVNRIGTKMAEDNSLLYEYAYQDRRF